MKMVDVVFANVRNRTYPYPYLGVGYLAAVLEQRGLEVRIVDGSALDLDAAGIAEAVRRLNPRVVGVTSMSPSVREAYQIVRAVRARLPEATVVLGGSHASADPDVIRDMGLRYGFAGEAEASFGTFCEHIVGGSEPPADLPGLVAHGRVNPAAPVQELDELPFPMRPLLSHGGWHHVAHGGFATVLASRGCPYDCSFCHHDRKMRLRTPENIVTEMERVSRDQGCIRFEFVDEVFTVHRAWVSRICELLRTRLPGITWTCETRVNLVDRELLAEMAASGCNGVAFGIESASNRVLQTLSKRQKVDQVARALELSRQVGIDPGGFLMLGLPGETEEDIQATIRFARDVAKRVTFSRTLVLPKTPLFEGAVLAGKVQRDVWRQFMLGNAELPYYVPDGMTERRMAWLYRMAVGGFHFRPERLLDLARGIRGLKDANAALRALRYSFKVMREVH
jgi:anaerobic magnesium-protoporphyrin IX monomethyl ester cyclase